MKINLTYKNICLKGCGEPGHPGVYVKVTGVLDWIHQVTGFPAHTGNIYREWDPIIGLKMTSGQVAFLGLNDS